MNTQLLDNEYIPCANFTIFSTDCTANTNYSQFIYNNLDLKKIMGSIYNKYDYFELVLNQCLYYYGSMSFAIVVSIDVDGFDFKNNNNINPSIDTPATVGFLKATSTYSGVFKSSDFHVTIFRKQPNINLKISYLDIMTRKIFTSSSLPVTSAFTFSIKPLIN